MPSDNFEIFVVFEILVTFEFSNGNFCEMAKNIGNFFFVIFGQINLFYILAEFEVDVMRPNDSAKMDKRALKGQIENFLSISRTFLISTTKINLEKTSLSDNLKIFMIQPVFG